MVRTIAVSRLKLNVNRIKIHPEIVDELTISMKEHGQREPILIGKSNKVYDGIHRVYASRRLGWSTLEYERLK